MMTDPLDDKANALVSRLPVSERAKARALLARIGPGAFIQAAGLFSRAANRPNPRRGRPKVVDRSDLVRAIADHLAKRPGDTVNRAISAVIDRLPSFDCLRSGEKKLEHGGEWIARTSMCRDLARRWQKDGAALLQQTKARRVVPFSPHASLATPLADPRLGLGSILFRDGSITEFGRRVEEENRAAKEARDRAQKEARQREEMHRLYGPTFATPSWLLGRT